MSDLQGLNPQPLWGYFDKICEVPRPSKKEEKIRKFLIDFSKDNNLEVKTDDIGNVIISKPASKGKENAPGVILQTHMDMVCEKNSDKVFDFDNDAIEPLVDENWVKANGTTLGADCGIGIAAQMAVLTADNISHGPLECLITVDEESGLTGAFGLKPGLLNGEMMLNLDSEDEGEIFIGCAGGIDTIGTLNYETTKCSPGSFALKLSISGLLGGHSGDDIDKGRGNAVKILNRFLWVSAKKYNIGISELNGGNLRNAIAREAYAIVTISNSKKENLVADFNVFTSELEFEYKKTEPKLKMNIESAKMPDSVLTNVYRDKLLNAVYACPHGVLEMSSQVEGMVETSTNLASVKFIDDKNILITTSQRSEVDSRKNYASEMVKAVLEMAGFEVINTDGYPGWTPNAESEVLKVTVDSYKRLFGVDPIVRSIHAGLECGLFLEKYPYLDMVSFGPTIRGAHSPDERIDINTTEKFWKHLVDVLENLN